MKIKDIEIGKQYAVKVGHLTARMTVREINNGMALGVGDGTVPDHMFQQVGVKPAAVLGEADAYFAEAEKQEEAERARRIAKIEAQQEINKHRKAALEELEHALRDRGDGPLLHRDTKERFTAFGMSETDVNCVNLHWRDVKRLARLIQKLDNHVERLVDETLKLRA